MARLPSSPRKPPQWITKRPCRRLRSRSTFAPQKAYIYQVAENGAISDTASADRKGFVDQAGLPVVEVRLAEKQPQRIRLAPTTQGFRVFVEESKTRADKPAKWKPLTNAERIRIGAAKAAELVARLQSGSIRNSDRRPIARILSCACRLLAGSRHGRKWKSPALWVTGAR